MLRPTAVLPPPLPRKHLPPNWTAPIRLPASLHPWRATTSDWRVKYRWCDGSEGRGVVAVVVVDVMKMLPVCWQFHIMCGEHKTTLDAAMVELREAMELADLHWQLHPPSLRTKLKAKSEAIVDDIDRQGACINVVGVEFELQVSGADMRLLGDVVAPMLVRTPDGGLFKGVRDKLVPLLESQSKARRPMHITINATLENQVGSITNWHVERFFSDMAGFAAYISRVNVDGLHQLESAVFFLYRIYVSVSAFPITPWVVQRVLELVKIKKHLVTFDKLVVDPRMIACANEDVRGLVQTVTEYSPQVFISTGDLPPMNNTPEHELCSGIRIEQLTSLNHGILGAVGGAKSMGSLDLSLLVFLMPKRQTRKIVWKALAEALSQPKTKPAMKDGVLLQEFMLNAPIKLDNEDAKMIRWERQRTGKQRRSVKTVSIDVTECSDSSVLELVSLFSGLESLSLSKRSGTFTAPILSRIVKRAPNLHSIELDRLAVDSEATVNELAHAAPWRSLSMTDVEVPKASVIFTFLRELGDPSCRLSKSLRVLRFSSRSNVMAVCNDAVLLVAKALQTNRVLQQLHLTVQNNVSSEAIAAVRCHDGDLVNEPQPRERIAFVSAINHAPEGHPLRRVDDHIASTIFAFIKIQHRRCVTIRLAPIPTDVPAPSTQ